MNRCDYSSSGVIKSLLMHMDDLLNCAERGDTVAHSIAIDLMDAVEHEATQKQGSCMQLWLGGYSQEEIAEKFQVTQQAVADRIHIIAKNISNFLM
jgi:DNA-directed RNA polymerase specialized sigma24 family protein